MIRNHRLIGLTGTNGSGKGEAAAWLRSRGYAYLSLSDVIRQELRRDGVAETRDAMIARGNALRRAFGPDVLARRVLLLATGPTVIDSIRNPSEVAVLRREEGFILLAFDAPAAVRFERVGRRGRDESALDLEAFLRKEDEERGSDPAAQQLDACIALADIRIMNDGTIEDLKRRLKEAL
ncbi:MAG: AAA family ATPase [Candidatus Aminicenantes bacterium]|nr:AAA family ATPase [Candidatus Aminicenantes bacterium]